MSVALGALLFLCSADKGFSSFRIGAYNFRLGQILLFLSVGFIVTCRKDLRRSIAAAARSTLFVRATAAFAGFVVAYGFSGLISPHPLHQGMKLAWIVLNVSAAFCLAVSARRSGVLTQGLRVGVALIALVILIDWCLLHWVGTTSTLGFFEKSYPFMGALVLRPHGFFYEPSYASCCLAFSALLAFVLRWKEAPALAFVVFLVGARSGLLTLAFAGFVFAVLGISKKHRPWFWRMAKGLGVFSGLIILVGLTPGGGRYLQYMTGPMGLSGIEYRLKRHFLAPQGDTAEIKDPFLKERCQGRFAEECRVWAGTAPGAPVIAMSEGQRIDSLVFAFRRWEQSPIFGAGVPVDGNGKLVVMSQSMWLEVLVESGIVGFLLFALMMILPWRTYLKSTGVPGAVFFVPFLAHLVVNMNFTQSVPRLDYWLLYFLGMFSIREIAKFTVSTSTH